MNENSRSKEYIAKCDNCGWTWVICICCIDRAKEETAKHVCSECGSEDWHIE